MTNKDLGRSGASAVGLPAEGGAAGASPAKPGIPNAALSSEQLSALWDARETIRSVIATQRGNISDLAVIALQDAAIEVGDIVLTMRLKMESTQ